jgi:hypothetical protein
LFSIQGKVHKEFDCPHAGAVALNLTLAKMRRVGKIARCGER